MFAAKEIKFLMVLACAFALVLVNAGRASAAGNYAAIVIDAGSGEILYSANPDDRKYPASLTKMMTLYMVFDALKDGRLRLNQRLNVSRRASRQPPSKLGLKPSQGIKVKDAILALVTKSANDVSVVVAENLAGSEWRFARLMTKKARKLGMRKTVFKNASGLPNRGQKTTARDMAVLSVSLMRDFPEYYHYFSTEQFAYKGKEYGNHNKLLTDYPGVDGIKTGYIRDSGFNLVASAKREGRRLIGVVFGGRSSKARNTHMSQLLDRGFTTLAKRDFQKRKTQLAAAPSRVTLPAARVKKIAAAKKPERSDGVVKTKQANPNLIYVSNDSPLSIEKRRFQPSFVVKKAAEADESIGAQETQIFVSTYTPKQEEPKEVVMTAAPAEVPLGTWAVQVGAFATAEIALQRAQKAISVLGSATSKPKAVSFQKNGHTYYRSRIVGFDQSAARQSCGQLKRSKIDCFAINTAN